METTEKTAPKTRRVGTFTLGAVLVLAGVWMLASWFLPLDPLWALKAAPAVLIALGLEVLLAARDGSRIKYDWAGMLLLFLLACGAAGMYALTWAMDAFPEEFNTGISSGVTEDGLYWEYTRLNGSKMMLLDLEAGDTLDISAVSLRGAADLLIAEDGDREVLYQQTDLPTGSFTVSVPESGTYEVWLTGRDAAGSVRLSGASALPDSVKEYAARP